MTRKYKIISPIKGFERLTGQVVTQEPISKEEYEYVVHYAGERYGFKPFDVENSREIFEEVSIRDFLEEFISRAQDILKNN
jgi:hypothetical protein